MTYNGNINGGKNFTSIHIHVINNEGGEIHTSITRALNFVKN